MHEVETGPPVKKLKQSTPLLSLHLLTIQQHQTAPNSVTLGQVVPRTSQLEVSPQKVITLCSQQSRLPSSLVPGPVGVRLPP